MGAGLFHETFDNTTGPEQNARLVAGDKSLAKLIFKSNHLNYAEHQIAGWYNQLNVEWIKTISGGENFFTAFHELRYFARPARRINWANRIRLGLSTNNANPFAPFVLDSYVNIRGVGDRVDRGTGSVVVNTELRYTVWDRAVMAVQGVAFADFGSWRQPGGSLDDFLENDNMRAFSGAGIRVIYKKAFDTMLRLDYGFDYNGNTGLVFGIGQYF